MLEQFWIAELSARDNNIRFYRDHLAIDQVKLPSSEQVADVVLAITDGKKLEFFNSKSFQKQAAHLRMDWLPPSFR